MKKTKTLLLIIFICSLTKLTNGQPVVNYELQKYILDEGKSGTCVACAISYLKTFQEAKKNGWDINSPEHMFSPSFLYNLLHPKGNPPGLSSSQAMNYVCTYGMGTLDMVQFTPEDDSTKPSLPAQYSATSYRNIGWESISFGEEGIDIEKIKQEVRKGPILCDMTGDASHTVCITGYDNWVSINDTLRGAFKYVNSYGPDWNINPTDTNPKHKHLYSAGGGYGWIPYGEVLANKYILYGFYYFKEQTKGEPIFILRFSGNIQNSLTDRFTGFLGFDYIKNQDTISKVSFIGNAIYAFSKQATNFGYAIYPNDKGFSFIVDSLELPDSLIVEARYKLGFVVRDDSLQDELLKDKLRLDSCLLYNKTSGHFDCLSFKTDTLNILEKVQNPFVIPPDGSYRLTSHLLAKIKLSNYKSVLGNGKSIFIYPNPTTGKITAIPSEGITVSLTNLYGQTICQYRLSIGQNFIDLGNLPTGMYFLGKNKIIKQ